MQVSLCNDVRAPSLFKGRYWRIDADKGPDTRDPQGPVTITYDTKAPKSGSSASTPGTTTPVEGMTTPSAEEAKEKARRKREAKIAASKEYAAKRAQETAPNADVAPVDDADRRSADASNPPAGTTDD
jgi:hypothetical protein